MNIKKIFLYMFATIAAASCTDDDLLPESDDNKSVQNIVFTIEDWKTDPETRTIVQYGGYSLWSVSKPNFDKICVVPNVDDSYGRIAIQFPLSSLTTPGPASHSSSSLSTTANSGWNMKNGVEYIAYYPAYNASAYNVSFSLSVPRAMTSSSLSTEMDYDMMYAKAKAGSSTISFNFQRKYSLLGVMLNNVPEKKYKSLTISNKNGDNVFNVSGTLDIKTGIVTPDKNRKFSSYLFSNPTTVNGRIVVLFPTLPTETGELYCLLVDADGEKYEATLPSRNVEEGYWTNWQMSVSHITSENGHEFVNLGLPSGLKWATMNMGATSVTDLGKYYAWGDIEPYDERSLVYDAPYKWAGVKYYSSVDNKRTLDLEDDIAHVSWGGSWRMPTRTDMEELMDNCYWVWTDDYNNTNAFGWIVFKAKNASYKGQWTTGGLKRPYSLADNHIFIPADPNSADAGRTGSCYYWLSTLDENCEDMGSDLTIWHGTHYINASPREWHCPVRAVCRSK